MKVLSKNRMKPSVRLNKTVTVFSTVKGLNDVKTMTVRGLQSKYGVSYGTAFNARAIVKQQYPELFTAE